MAVKGINFIIDYQTAIKNHFCVVSMCRLMQKLTFSYISCLSIESFVSICNMFCVDVRQQMMRDILFPGTHNVCETQLCSVLQFGEQGQANNVIFYILRHYLFYRLFSTLVRIFIALIDGLFLILKPYVIVISYNLLLSFNLLFYYLLSPLLPQSLAAATTSPVHLVRASCPANICSFYMFLTQHFLLELLSQKNYQSLEEMA